MPAFSCAVRGPPAAGAGARRGLRAASSGGLRVRSLFVRRRRARRRACCSGCFPHVAHGHATKKWWQGALTKIGMDGRLYCTPDTGRYPNLARPCVCVCVCQHEDARGPGPHPTGQGTATRAGAWRAQPDRRVGRPTARKQAGTGHGRSARTVYPAAYRIGASAARTHGRPTGVASTGATRPPVTAATTRSPRAPPPPPQRRAARPAPPTR